MGSISEKVFEIEEAEIYLGEQSWDGCGSVCPR